MTQPLNPPSGLLPKYSDDKACCTICDAKKVCTICGDQTLLACSDCRIDFQTTVYVCRKPCCRDAHEEKCSAELRKRLSAQPPAAPAGWRVVPEEATPEMIEAAGRKGAVFGFGFHHKVALAAAPTPPNSAMRSADEWAEFIWNNCRIDRPAYRDTVYGENLSIKEVVRRIQQDALASRRA